MKEKIEQHCDNLAETLKRKNADYGNSFALPGILSSAGPEEKLFIRMDDKLQRIKALRNKPPEVSDEPLRDSLQDLAGYCILMLILLDDDQKGPRQ